MAQYELDTLVDWLRRTVGDTVIAFRENYTADGLKRLEIRNDGNIRLRLVEQNDVEVNGDNYTLEGNRILWGDGLIPPSGDNLYLVYDRAERSDAEYLDRLVDAAKWVADLIHVHWLVLPDDGIIDDVQNELMSDGVTANNGIEKLIVFRAALNVLTESATTTAKASIAIRDGDTSIDTSKGANNIASLLREVRKAFDKEHAYFVANRFVGTASAQG